MGALDATFTAIAAKRTADSGAGGLSGTGNGRIDTLLRDTDSNNAPGGVYAIVSVSPAQNYDQTTTGYTVVDVTFAVTVEAGQGFTRTNAIRDRLYTVFHNVTMGEQGSYSFSPMVWLASDDRKDGTKRILIERYQVVVFLTIGAPWFGSQASFSGYSGGTPFFWQLSRTIETVDVTDELYNENSYDVGRTDDRFVVRFHVKAKPPTPGLYTNVIFTMASGETLTGDAIVHNVTHVANIGQSRTQICEASGIISGGLT